MSFYKVLKHTIVFKLINTVFVFLINLLLIRLLGATDSGIFFYDIAVCSFIILLLSWSMDSGVNYYASKNNQLITPLFGFVTLLLMVQVLFCWILIHFLKFSIGSFLAIIFIISNLALIYATSLLYALKKFRLLNIVTSSINLLITVILFYCFKFKVFAGTQQYYMAIYIIGIAILALLILIILLIGLKKNTLPFVAISPVIKNIFSYSSVAIISNVITFLVTRMDYFFVQKHCSSVALSNYIQVSKFGQLLILIPIAIASIVFPLSASDTRLITLDKVQQLCRGITIIFVFATIIIILTAHKFLPWFYGGNFDQMYIALLFYLPGFFAFSITTILAAHLAGIKQLKTNLTASVVALSIVFTGDILFIPVMGINAAAAVSSIGYIAGAVYLLFWYKKKYNCTTSDFIVFNKKDIIYFLHQFLP